MGKWLYEVCKKCGCNSRIAFSVRDDIWAKLPDKWQNHVLCLNCFLEELEKVSPDEEISWKTFNYLAFIGLPDNDFGGTLIETDYRENNRAYKFLCLDEWSEDTSFRFGD